MRAGGEREEPDNEAWWIRLDSDGVRRVRPFNFWRSDPMRLERGLLGGSGSGSGSGDEVLLRLAMI